MSGRTAALLAVLALIGGALPLGAQNTTLTVTGLPAVFPTPTGAEFHDGAIVYSTYTTYTVTGNNWTPNLTRTETISIRCNTPCPFTGPKPLATLQWKRTAEANWHTLTTAFVIIEAPVLRSTAANRNPTYSNTIQWQFLLNWTADPPGALTTFNVRIRLRQTT